MESESDTRDIAQRLGFHNLVWNRKSSTANGAVLNAKITVERVEIANITLSYFEVYVAGGKLDTCLIGAAWLNQVRYEVSNGVLTIWPKGV